MSISKRVAMIGEMAFLLVFKLFCIMCCSSYPVVLLAQCLNTRTSLPAVRIDYLDTYRVSSTWLCDLVPSCYCASVCLTWSYAGRRATRGCSHWNSSARDIVEVQ